jgi:hypothetical protein
MEQHQGGRLLWLQLLQDRNFDCTKKPMGEPIPSEVTIKSLHIHPNGKAWMDGQ